MDYLYLMHNTIATLGSHCSLQVLKGAKDEGFKTLLICLQKNLSLYKRFKFIDRIICVDKFENIIDRTNLDILHETDSILIPHGTLISSMSQKMINDIDIPIFGNRNLFEWEADRIKKQKLLEEANIRVPKEFNNKDEIDRLCIVKLHGAAGGKGYFLAKDRETFEKLSKKLIQDRIIDNENELYIQEYVIGVPAYLQYFYSSLTKTLEFMGVDKRYESDIDGLARIPAQQQLINDISPTYTVVGNSSLVLRESLLTDVFEMGDRFVNACYRNINGGIPGPFCLEGVYDSNGNFTSFEFSGRIVAGTNLYTDGSPYSVLLYDEPMSTGRRIAREIKDALSNNRLNEVTS